MKNIIVLYINIVFNSCEKRNYYSYEFVTLYLLWIWFLSTIMIKKNYPDTYHKNFKAVLLFIYSCSSIRGFIIENIIRFQSYVYFTEVCRAQWKYALKSLKSQQKNLKWSTLLFTLINCRIWFALLTQWGYLLPFQHISNRWV